MKNKAGSISQCTTIMFRILDADKEGLLKAEKRLMERKKTEDPSEISATDILREVIRSYK